MFLSVFVFVFHLYLYLCYYLYMYMCYYLYLYLQTRPASGHLRFQQGGGHQTKGPRTGDDNDATENYDKDSADDVDPDE